MVLGAGCRAAVFSVRLFGCVFVCVFSSFWAFFGPFLVLGAGRPCCFFFGRAFCVCVFVCVFSSFWAFFGPYLVLGAGRRAAFFFGRACWVCFCLCFLFFLCFFWSLFGPAWVLLFFRSGFLGVSFLFMKAILSFFDFLAIFFFSFLL